MKKFVVTLSILMLVGCAGTSFNLGDNPVLNTILLACGDVPVAEFDECVQELKSANGSEDMTIAELVELLKTFETDAETPVE
jgi:hypothetical protein